jgi:hypothetical protein
MKAKILLSRFKGVLVFSIVYTALTHILVEIPLKRRVFKEAAGIFMINYSISNAGVIFLGLNYD